MVNKASFITLGGLFAELKLGVIEANYNQTAGYHIKMTNAAYDVVNREKKTIPSLIKDGQLKTVEKRTGVSSWTGQKLVVRTVDRA